MVELKILIPEATVNYITNPSLRYDTTGWNAQGSSISRVLTRARFGISGLQVATNGAVVHEGASFRVSSLTGFTGQITVSAYVRGDGQVRIRLDDNAPGGDEWYSEAVQLSDDHWTRIEVTGQSSGGDDLRLYVETDEAAAVVRTFYVDGAQMECKGYSTTYCDGDQEGCLWNGIYHGSTSERLDSTRAGGKWFQVAGTEREEEDLYMTVVGGLGMPPLTNNTQSFALADGGYFQDHKTNMRVTTLTFFAKHHINDTDEPVSLSKLHQLRQLLIDIIKPDRTSGDEQIHFCYNDGDTTLYFTARYDGGLEGDWDVRNQFVNSFPLRLLSVDPYLEEDSQEADALDFQNNLAGFLGIVMRKDGEWQNMNYGTDDNVTSIAIGPKGEIVIAGNFNTVNNNAAAIDPLLTANGIAYWDGEKWNAYGSGMNDVTGGPDLAVGLNGNVYVSGNFTSIGGVAANRIAYWDGSAWNAMGTGISGGNASIQCLLVAPNGDVYVGGSFTNAGGVTVAGIARWDGSSWHRVGQFGGLNSFVLCMAITRDGATLYVGGQFTSENGGGQTLNRVTSYNTSTGLFGPMDNGFNSDVECLELADNGYLYAGGLFTTNGDGDTTLNRTAYWNGSVWVPMGTGMDAGVYSMSPASLPGVYAQGLFTAADGKDIAKLAFWNGSVWTNIDFKFPSSILPFFTNSLLYNPKTEILYTCAGVVTATPLNAGITYVDNPGSAEISPMIYAIGSGTLYWIENQTTKNRLYLNLDIAENEEVFFDFGRGKMESTIRGSLFYTLLSGSDFVNFHLRPGENKIACFMVNDVNAMMSIQLVPRHWSVDATQRETT